MNKLIATVMLLMMWYAVDAQEIYEYKFLVEGNCGMCKDRIESIAINKGNAKYATWDVDTKILTVDIEEPTYSILTIKSLLAAGGHDNGDYKATKEVYDNLHSCCQYRVDDVESSVIDLIEDQEDKNQDHIIHGTVLGINASGDKEALVGASVELIGSDVGVVTDVNGSFSIHNHNASNKILISYLGYETQAVDLEDGKYLTITLADGIQLKEFEVVYQKRSTEISFINPLRSETITRDELCKAACCNLSESFETNPSVDISYNDAVTGTSQIQMLGLAGQYVQITRELIPDIRGLNTAYGLSMTPGPWIESIQLIKGIGSVVNGYEGMAGQINVELKKPDVGEDFFLNGYLNNGGRVELNTNFRKELNPYVSTAILASGKRINRANDNNDDGFVDMPLENDYLLVNRWSFNTNVGITAQLGAKLSLLDHRGGSLALYDDEVTMPMDTWSSRNETDRYELFGKLGYIFPDSPQRSVGLQWQAVSHDQRSSYGLRRYDALQRSWYSNLIFQNIFENNHILRAGISYQYDEIEETVSGAGEYDRKASVPGIFAEYTYNKDKWHIIPGIRVDQHNLFGTFVTPRLHMKYDISDKSVLRLAAGRGQKTANIFIENSGLFASNRAIVVDGNNAKTPYSLESEVAWNVGVSYNQEWTIATRSMVFTLDLFTTRFDKQVVVDYENPRAVSFYNLEGSSVANSFQAKIDYELVPKLQVRLAYRLFDVTTDYKSGNLVKPLISRHRAFINAEYKTDNGWAFDYTLNWRGQKRLPNTQANPVAFRRADYSPNYLLSNAQISKSWGEKFDLYVGGENIFNYQQQDAIIDAQNPFSETFDASMIWAPIFGANFYVGFRLNLGD